MNIAKFIGAAVAILTGVPVFAGETLPPLEGNKPPQTFEQLWQGFDPRAEPLEVEVLKEWEEDGVVLRVLRYRVGVFKGKKAIMAAVYGFPKHGKNLPGLVQIHGGGQYGDYRAPLWNAKRGYATISLAWAGRINAPQYRVTPDIVKLFWEGKTDDPRYKMTTDWGALDAYHAPCRYPGNAFPKVEPAPWTLDSVESPRNSPWFLCALAARRALTFLEQQPEVDPAKLGVYGHSMGGKLTVMTAAADNRVKACAPSCGGVSDRSNRSAIFRTTLGDDVSLRHIRCPIIFLNPSNDFHARINDIPKAVEEIMASQWRVVSSPHHNHQDTPEYMVGGMLWFDQWLKNSFEFPHTPELKVELATPDRIPLAVVVPDESQPIVSVDVFYTQQGKDEESIEEATSRFWHYGQPKKQGKKYVAKLPLHGVDRPLWVYANITYKLERPVSGAGYYYRPYRADRFVVSCPIVIVRAEQLQAAGVQGTLEPSLVIETFEGDWRKHWYTYDPEDWAIRTHKINDPQWKAPTGAKLAIDVCCEQPNTLVVGIDNYAAARKIAGGNRWQTLVFDPADFTDVDGQPMDSWQGKRELRLGHSDLLRGGSRSQPKVVRVGGAWRGNPPEFRNLRWLVGHETL